MVQYLGCNTSECSDNAEYHNSYKIKTININFGYLGILVPQDRKVTFESQIVKKHQNNISEIDQKIILMYAKVLSTC